MLTANAVKKLRLHGAKVKRLEAGEYRAHLNGYVVSFQDVGGRVVELKLNGCRAMSVAEALRVALYRRAVVSVPDVLPDDLIVAVEHEGASLRPIAAFTALLKDGLYDARFRSRRPDALGMAEAVLAGEYDTGVLLDWLEEFGGKVGEVVGRARQGLPLPPWVPD